MASTGGKGLVHGQDPHTAGAATGATEVAGIARGGLHIDIEIPGSGNHGGSNRGCDLRITRHRGRERAAVEDQHGGRNELAAGRGQDETGRQLCEGNGCRRDRV